MGCPCAPGDTPCRHRRGLQHVLMVLLVLGGGNLHQWRVMQSQGGQLAAPDATRVQANDIGTNQQAQGRPVPEDYGVVLDSAARHIEPGHEPIGVMRWSSCMRELQIGRATCRERMCHYV